MSRIVPYLQANKLACYCSLDAGRGTRLLGLSQRTLLFMAWQIAWASFDLHWFLVSPNSPGDDAGGPRWIPIYAVGRAPREELWALGIHHFYSRWKLFVGGLGRHSLIPEGGLLYPKPWEMAPVRSGQRLAYWMRMCRVAQGLGLIASRHYWY